MNEQDTAAQQKVDVARQQRDIRNQEADRKRDQEKQKADQAKQQGLQRQQDAATQAANNEVEKKARNQKQADEKAQKADRNRQDAAQRRQDQQQREKDRADREAEGEGEGEADSSLAQTVAQAAAQGVKAALDNRGKKKEKKEHMLSFGDYIKEQPANFAGQDTRIAGLGGDEPIVRGSAVRRQDCSKCKGAGCPICTPMAFIRRAEAVAEDVMRELKAERIARDVMEQTGGNGGGNGGNGGMNGGMNGNGDGNGIGGIGRGVTGHTSGRKCPPGKVWDGQRNTCVSAKEQSESLDEEAKVRSRSIGKDNFEVLLNGKFIGQVHRKKEGKPGWVYTGQQQFDTFGTRKAATAALVKAKQSGKLKETVEILDIPAAEPTTQTFAGSPVFKVTPETFAKCSGGRSKWSHWSKVLNLEDEGQAAIRTYANKYPSRPIVLQCNETGDMKFLRFNRKGGGGNRRRRKHALPTDMPTPTDGGTGQVIFDDPENEQVTEGLQKTITPALRKKALSFRSQRPVAGSSTYGSWKIKVRGWLESQKLSHKVFFDLFDVADKESK